MKFKFFLFLVLNFHLLARSQIQIGIKITGLAFHPKPLNSDLYQRKLDKTGHFVINRGILFTVQANVWKCVGIGFAQAFMPQDCADKRLGASQIGVSLLGNLNNQHSFSGIFGPIIFYRQSWKSISNYQDDGLFKDSRNKALQYKFVWYGGHLEYTYWFSKQAGLAVNVLPGIPMIFELSPGVNFRNLPTGKISSPK